MSRPVDFDVIVAGAGPAGLAAACLAAARGFATAVVTGPRETRPDPRTVALMMPSLAVLEACGLWPGELRAATAPLRKLRLVDDTGALFAAPELVFSAREAGLDAFGWNIPLALLKPGLEARAGELGVRFLTASATGCSAEADAATVTLDDGTAFTAKLFLAGDGRNSALRNAVGIDMVSWSYDQTAIAVSFDHSQPHRDISSEYHKPAGPFTTVPLPGRRSSLVWMERPARAEALMQLDDKALAAEIQVMSHGELGLVSEIGPRRSFPMSGARAVTFARNRVMLIGEAAHTVPPIGAQGLNMSFRDAQDAIMLAVQSRDRNEDIGATKVLAEYDLRRQRDVRPRQTVIDLMNRSLLSAYLPLEAGRAAGLAALASFGPLRRFAMQMGLGAALPH
ncbi:MAG TPA: FAD-dependent monooxygenase [Nordella sp.]|nr:FAD-dependent monooxygenase [Nordella sp.]